MRRKEHKPLIVKQQQAFFEENLPVIPGFAEERPRFSRTTSHFLHNRCGHDLFLFYQWLTKEFLLKATGKSGPGWERLIKNKNILKIVV
jgi:hypothetical protein